MYTVFIFVQVGGKTRQSQHMHCGENIQFRGTIKLEDTVRPSNPCTNQYHIEFDLVFWYPRRQARKQELPNLYIQPHKMPVD